MIILLLRCMCYSLMLFVIIVINADYVTAYFERGVCSQKLLSNNVIERGPDLCSPYFEDLPDMIKTIMIRERRSTKISLRWEPYSQYINLIYDYLLTFYNGTTSFIVNVEKKEITFENLIPCTVFSITIYPRSNAKDIIGAGKTIHAKTIAVVPDYVSNINVVKYSSHSVILEWTAPKFEQNCISKYKLSWFINYAENVIEYANETKYMLSSLEPCTIYRIKISSVNYEGAEGRTQLFTFSTLAQDPSPVEEVNVSENNGLNVFWKSPKFSESCVQNYEIKLCEVQNETYCQVHIVNKSDIPVDTDRFFKDIFNTIDPCTRYNVIVTPTTATKVGIPYGYTYTTQPKIFNKPIKGIIGSINSTEAVIKWMLNTTTAVNKCGPVSCLIQCFEIVTLSPLYEMEIVPVFYSNAVHVNLQELEPFTNYSCAISLRNVAGYSEFSDYVAFETNQSVPSEPTNVAIYITQSYGFQVKWEPPLKKNGILTTYKIMVESTGFQYNIPSYCDYVQTTVNQTITVYSTVTNYRFTRFKPYEGFIIRIVASTIAGYGNSSAVIEGRTQSFESEGVKEQKIEQNMTGKYQLKWKQPCYVNGILKCFKVNITGKRRKHIPHLIETDVAVNRKDINREYLLELETLFPEYKYEIFIQPVVYYVESDKSISLHFTSPSAIPESPSVERFYKHVLISSDKSKDPEHQITLIIKNDLFDDKFGDLLYYSIVVYRDHFHNRIQSEHLNVINEWPHIENWANSSKYNFIQPYQATPIRWNPFITGKSSVHFTIGEDDSCWINDSDYCNGPLLPGVNYFMKIRAFTKTGFQETVSLKFTTDKETDFSYLIVLVTLLMMIGVIIGGIYYTRNRANPLTIQISEKSNLSEISKTYPPPDVSPKTFIQYTAKFLESAEDVKAEFLILGTLSSCNAPSITVAYRPENYIKNRYTNILPYDITRVLVDSNSTSDYINASFIQGYNNIERRYIAAQGPISDTCRDFWKMILQYNVTVIVMLCQITERMKVKCEKYFPDLRETLTFDDISIECVSFETYSSILLRSIIITKGCEKTSVFHVHFQEWPDFGVPMTPNYLIDLCKFVRKYNNDGKIAVHCSAGVGRTGTYIACDMLLDYIKNNKNINIFNLVLKLRRQRPEMVQSEVQYRFLYRCAVCALDKISS